MSEYIRTFTGRKFFPLDPNPADIDIIDIAHALSMQCRYTGHTKEFYSVAQHSTIISFACPDPDALWGLLHDASEAYLSDISSPVKRDPRFSFYREAEKKLMDVICSRFELPFAMPEIVNIMDRRLLNKEQEVFCHDDHSYKDVDKMRVRLVSLTPKRAFNDFMNRFEEIQTWKTSLNAPK